MTIAVLFAWNYFYIAPKQKALRQQRMIELRDKAMTAWHTSLELAPDQHDLADLVRKYAPKYTGPKL